MGEFTYNNNIECDFSSWNLIRGSVSFLDDQLFLVLSDSKTDPFCQGVTLTISATINEACAVKSLRNLFERFPKVYYQPLFATYVPVLELSAAITLQNNSKKEFAPWVTSEIIRAIHFGGELQHLQD